MVVVRFRSFKLCPNFKLCSNFRLFLRFPLFRKILAQKQPENDYFFFIIPPYFVDVLISSNNAINGVRVVANFEEPYLSTRLRFFNSVKNSGSLITGLLKHMSTQRTPFWVPPTVPSN